jgi:hypothetical protein
VHYECAKREERSDAYWKVTSNESRVRRRIF